MSKCQDSVVCSYVRGVHESAKSCKATRTPEKRHPQDERAVCGDFVGGLLEESQNDALVHQAKHRIPKTL